MSFWRTFGFAFLITLCFALFIAPIVICSVFVFALKWSPLWWLLLLSYLIIIPTICGILTKEVLL